MNTNNYYDNAMTQYYQNNLLEAAKLFNSMLDQEPSHHQSINMLGLIASNKGNLEESSDYIKKAVELDSSVGSYRNNLGVVYLLKNDFKSALSEFLKAIELAPDNSEAYANAGYVCYRKGDFNKAKEFLDKALQYNSDNLQAYLHGAVLCREMNDNTQALGFYNNVIRLNPDCVDAYLQTAEIYFEVGAYNEALKNYLIAMEIKPSLVNNQFLKGSVRQIYSRLFPYDRFSFYNNKEKLFIYGEAIKNSINKDSHVLEYSNAEGLLSLFSAKECAKKVTLVMVEPFLAVKAEQLAKTNKVDSKVNVINKEPHDLAFGVDVDEKVDFLICDIFGDSFPSFKELLMAQSLKERFLKDKGVVFPQEIKLMAAPISSVELWERGSVDDVLGLDASALNDFRPLFSREMINRYDYETLAEPFELYSFDLTQTPEQSWKKSFAIAVEKDQTLHGLAIWNTLRLDKNHVILGGPSDNKKNYQFVLLLDETIECKRGQTLEIEIDYSDAPMITEITINEGTIA